MINGLSWFSCSSIFWTSPRISTKIHAALWIVQQARQSYLQFVQSFHDFKCWEAQKFCRDDLTSSIRGYKDEKSKALSVQHNIRAFIPEKCTQLWSTAITIQRGDNQRLLFAASLDPQLFCKYRRFSWRQNDWQAELEGCKEICYKELKLGWQKSLFFLQMGEYWRAKVTKPWFIKLKHSLNSVT